MLLIKVFKLVIASAHQYNCHDSTNIMEHMIYGIDKGSMPLWLDYDIIDTALRQENEAVLLDLLAVCKLILVCLLIGIGK